MGGTEEKSQYSVTFILFSGILFVVAVFISIACLVNSVHRVQEGNIAIYFKNGALLREISEPGIHMASRKLRYNLGSWFITLILQPSSPRCCKLQFGQRQNTWTRWNVSQRKSPKISDLHCTAQATNYFSIASGLMLFSFDQYSWTVPQGWCDQHI